MTKPLFFAVLHVHVMGETRVRACEHRSHKRVRVCEHRSHRRVRACAHRSQRREPGGEDPGRNE